jgi:glycosyltransferase involved in cell wall biosynthesis
VNHVIDHGYGHLVSSLPAERTVVTFHDSTVTKVEGASRGTRLSLRYSLRSIRKAAAVIADSESSRRDFLGLVSYPAERVHVVYPGVDGSFKVYGEKESLRSKLRLPDRYVLHVGHCLPYMNVEGVLLTLDQLVRRHKVDVSLVKVGGQFTQAQQAMIGRLGLGDRILHLARVPFVDLPAIYNCADVLLYPALYAGFGLPPLEAMACGTPVVCSDRGSLLEVTGGAALTADPEHAPDLAERVAGLMSDERLREEHVAKGLRQANRYSWGRNAREVLSVYRWVMNA